ncbi:hypothetical protein B0H19DRAFT_1084950 [Mycena capillaripes]|nr:hypothetical protein B0H19DRAFT_1084950 [Mycena capillaripes]
MIARIYQYGYSNGMRVFKLFQGSIVSIFIWREISVNSAGSMYALAFHVYPHFPIQINKPMASTGLSQSYSFSALHLPFLNPNFNGSQRPLPNCISFNSPTGNSAPTSPTLNARLIANQVWRFPVTNRDLTETLQRLEPGCPFHSPNRRYFLFKTIITSLWPAQYRLAIHAGGRGRAKISSGE